VVICPASRSVCSCLLRRQLHMLSLAHPYAELSLDYSSSPFMSDEPQPPEHEDSGEDPGGTTPQSAGGTTPQTGIRLTRIVEIRALLCPCRRSPVGTSGAIPAEIGNVLYERAQLVDGKMLESGRGLRRNSWQTNLRPEMRGPRPNH